MNPPAIKGLEGMAVGIHKWEAKVSALMCRYKEEVNSNLKFAIFIGMMPRDSQDVILQQGCGKDIGYEQIQDYVLNICHQKCQMLKPVPMDVGQLAQGFSGDVGDYQSEFPPLGEGDLGVVSQGECYNCGDREFLLVNAQVVRGKGIRGRDLPN